jgi:hypothetical protein
MKLKAIVVALLCMALLAVACSLPCGALRRFAEKEATEIVPKLEKELQPQSDGEDQPPAEGQPGSEAGDEPQPPAGSMQLAALEELDSYRQNVTWRGEAKDGSHAFEVSILDEWIRATPARHLRVSSSQEGGEATVILETIRIGDTSWLWSGDRWIEVPGGDPLDMGSLWSNPFIDLDDWEPAGREQANGVQCRRYQSTERTTFTVPQVEEGGTVKAKVSGEMWVADQPGLPPALVRQKIKIEGGAIPLSLPGIQGPTPDKEAVLYWESNLTDINEPFEIAPPEDAETLSGE